MTYEEICDRFRESGLFSEESVIGREAALLMEHICGVSSAALPLQRKTDFPSPALLAAVERRLTGCPLQYVLGEWGFWEQTYKVTPACLIPREDTELLVERAIQTLPRGAYFADLCTGSGCVAISTLASRPDCRAVAVDLFEDTLAVARENAVRNGVADRIELCLDDVLAPKATAGAACYDGILANPPYVRTEVISTLAPELAYEPAAALDGGEDGMTFYRAIVENYKGSLREGGRFLFEIGYDQGEAIAKLAMAHGFTCSIYRDLSGNDRVAILY